ncbi:stage II sporulation protein M [Olivibacter sitiensis]|uniref:stage II sporulation protein M n=1 Tax=Olivibacter sitiensis TaxID=376470 RepID=UPI00041F5511|nr:stage II sporulation protein M [Olivibacter sitiensis]
MREALFVKKNTSKWENYESIPTENPDEIASRFIEVTDDLSFAKTFYPKSKTTSYLNGLAYRLHQAIYKTKPEKKDRLLRFWKEELPLVFYHSRKQLLYAFVSFCIFFLIGLLSSALDDTFVRLILGDAYVDMTLDNIAKGQPFGVYSSMDPLPMFLLIASNNVKVSFFAFLLGILGGVGTVVLLVYNGVMLGAFQYFFYSHQLGVESVLVIWIHGTLEIAAIIVSGAAGLVLGKGLLFPRTYTRLYAVKQAAKEGIKMIIGLVPVFIIAALLESFVTRHTEMPTWLSAFILLSSAAFIIWYVAVYPRKIYLKTTKIDHLNEQ